MRKHYESCNKKNEHVREKIKILKQTMKIEDKERIALM